MTREEREKAIYALKISAPLMAVTQGEFNDYIQTLNKIMDWLEQEPCDDAISRRAALDAVCESQCGCKMSDCEYLFADCPEIEKIEQLPPVNLPDNNVGRMDCISRQAVLDCLTATKLKKFDFILQTRAEIKKLPSVTPAEKVGHWIPVSERLPDIRNYCHLYLVTYKHGQICTAFFTETNGRCWWSIDGVTAWMPLPEPYKASPTGTESEVSDADSD